MILNLLYIRIVFPCTVYTSGSLKQDSVGAMIWEQVKAKCLKAARSSAQPAQVQPAQAMMPQAEGDGCE
jgi:hypothetical protein